MKKNRFVPALAILGAFLGAACTVLAQPLTFSSDNIACGNGPAAVVSVDINGDGHPGLVSANFGFRYGYGFPTGGGTGNTLTVLTNDGHGNLSFGQTLTVGLEPASIVVADVNGDGAPDLICANIGSDSLTVLTNNRKGGFRLEGTIHVGHVPAFVTAADVNGDGSVDLICANYNDNTLSVLINNGHGVFKLGSTLKTGSQPGCIAAADINGDGKVDLICANDGDNTLTVFTNNGPGVFTTSTTIHVAPATGVGYIVATDVDQDGTVDLIDVGTNNILNVFTNDGQGSFSFKSSVVSSGSGVAVAADMNGDGRVDLVCPNNGNGIQGSATVLTNDGHGNFTQNTVVPIGITDWQPIGGNYPSYICAGDFNGDGNMDIAVSCFGTSVITALTQTGATPKPIVTIASPANDAVIPLNDSFTITATALSTSNIEVFLYYLGTNILAASTNAPFGVEIAAGKVPAGTHSLQAVAIDSAGHTGWSPEIQITVTSASANGPPPVVSITSPTNGASFPTNENIPVDVTVSSPVSRVQLFADSQLLSQIASLPYDLQIPAGSLAPGNHTLQAVAVNSQNVSGTSAVVSITVTTPGIALIDFDALDATGGAVGGALLADYLGGYGVSVSDVTGGSALEAVNTNSLTGSIQVEVPSAPNFFTQAGLNQPVSFTLRFATALESFGFTRAGLSSASGLVTHPQWTATAFDGNGNELGSVTEGLIISASPVAARTFVLPGNGIASVRFDSDSQQAAAFSAVLLDNLVLDYNAVASPLSVGLSVTSPPTNDIVSPATLTLQAAVNDQVSSSYYVSFYAGPALLGTVSNSPYQFTWNGVLPGNYSLQASVVDSTGLTELSPVVPIAVQLGPESEVVNFDALNTSRTPVEGTPLNQYLAGYGISVGGMSAGTLLAVENQQNIAGGGAVLAASPPNVLTQIGSSGPVQFTLRFAPLLSQFGFTRPELLANPFVSHPAWQVTALDGSGVIVGQVSEGQIDSSTNVAAREFSLGGTGGPGIASVIFSSQGTGLTTFNGMLADNFILTTNQAGFPPAVAITQPVAGQVLAAPPALAVTAAAFDPSGITGVGFYASGILIGMAKTPPYTILWENPSVGNHVLKAVATNALGVTWTSPLVRILIQPSATRFGIASPPASQTVAAGGSVTFAVVTTGTNGVGYQWSHNGAPIAGQTLSTLVLPPPIADADAGTYTVTATADGTITNASAVLTVVDPPVFTAQPQGQTVAAGTEVTLRPGASGGGTLTWRWLLNGTAIPGATNRIYSIVAAQPQQSGNYQVVVANALASALSAVAPVIVETAVTISESNDNFANRASINPLLGPVSDSNQLATVEPGEPLPDGMPGGKSIWFTWHAGFTGTISLTTAGSDFETLLAVYTGTQLKSLKAVAADAGSGGYLTSLVTFNVTEGTDYQIAVDGYQGASGRVVLGLAPGTGYRTLNPSTGDSVPVIVRGPASKVVAPGAGVTFNVAASSPAKITYQWYFEGAPIAGATGSAFVISHVQPGSVGLYDVRVANAAGSAQSEPASLQIGVNPGGPVTSAQNRFVDSSGSASPKDLAYELRPTALGGDTQGFSVAQTFSTAGAAREPGEPSPCGQVGGAPQWFVYTAPASGRMQVNTEGSTFNVLLGIYTGSGTSFSNLLEVGCGYTTNYATDGEPSVVLPSVAKGTTFYILVDGYQGDSGLAQLRIGLGQTLSFRSLPPSQMLVTAGQTATFNVTAIGSTPFSYQWQLNGVNVPGATAATFKVLKAQESAVGNYTVIVSNSLGAVTSSPPSALTVQYAPAIESGPSTLTVTLGQPARFSVTALGLNVKTNPFVCQWYFNKEPVPKTDSLTLSIPVTRLTNSGTYDLVISNTYGSVTSAPAVLNVVEKADQQTSTATVDEAAGTYSGLFYPAEGATQASSGFLTATVASQGEGAFSANLLIDGGSYPFTGKFDADGNANVIVPRAGKAPVSATLHLDSSQGQMTGVISGADWRSALQAGRAATDAAPVSASQFALVIPSGSNTPVGYLALTNTTTATTTATALVTGTLADGASLLRAAPVVKGETIPFYAPLYSGKGLFLGWITLTNSPANAFWITPNSTNSITVLFVK